MECITYGSYTVKSAYKMCVSISDQWSNYHVSGDWKLIWSLCVPPKIKHFCWRLLRGCLPTRSNFQSRGVHCQSTCVVCNCDLEDEMHMFMHCKFAIDCWKAANLWGKIASYMTSNGSFSFIMFAVTRSLEVENHVRFVAILWSIWCARNACLWEQKPVNAHTSCVLALDTVHDFMWCNRPSDTLQPATPRWSKLQADWIKCNVDCALFKAEGKFGVGICFLDSLGHLIQAHSMVFSSISTAVEGEATALQQALQIALDLGLNRVVFETDCQLVVNDALSNSPYVNELGSLLFNCRALLFSNATYALAYVRRQANRVAHNLARASILHASPSIFNHPPYCIDSIIVDEIK